MTIADKNSWKRCGYAALAIYGCGIGGVCLMVAYSATDPSTLRFSPTTLVFAGTVSLVLGLWGFFRMVTNPYGNQLRGVNYTDQIVSRTERIFELYRLAGRMKRTLSSEDKLSVQVQSFIEVDVSGDALYQSVLELARQEHKSFVLEHTEYVHLLDGLQPELVEVA